MYASNWEEKSLKVLERKKSNFINIIGDKLAMNIR